VLLVGDWNYEGGQIEYRHIPMWYIHNPELGYWSDDVATDWYYGDVDGDDDIDVYIGRLPVHNGLDLDNYMFKLLLHSAQAGTTACSNTVLFFVEDADREGRNGWLVREHAEEIAARFGNNWNMTMLFDQWPYDYSRREEEACRLMNAGCGIHVSIGTISNRSKNANFQNLPQGFSLDKLGSNCCSFFWLGVSCDIGDVDMDETFGRPLSERFLFAGDKGAHSVFAPTRGGYEFPHYWLGKRVVELLEAALQSQGVCRLGRVCAQAQNELLDAWPCHADQIRSYVFLGDPAVELKLSGGLPLSVNRRSQKATRLFEAVPNPFSASVMLTLRLPARVQASVRIFDVSGRLIRTLAAVGSNGGTKRLVWNGRSDGGSKAGSGVYFCVLETPQGCETKKLVLLR
jgi:hypothetical protein